MNRYTTKARMSLSKRNEFGIRNVPDGFLEGEVEVTIDLDRLLRQMGRQALGNSTGKAVGLSGIIRAKVISKQRVAT